MKEGPLFGMMQTLEHDGGRLKVKACTGETFLVLRDEGSCSLSVVKEGAGPLRPDDVVRWLWIYSSTTAEHIPPQEVPDAAPGFGSIADAINLICDKHPELVAGSYHVRAIVESLIELNEQKREEFEQHAQASRDALQDENENPY
jgi:hypothetical protein